MRHAEHADALGAHLGSGAQPGDRFAEVLDRDLYEFPGEILEREVWERQCDDPVRREQGRDERPEIATIRAAKDDHTRCVRRSLEREQRAANAAVANRRLNDVPGDQSTSEVDGRVAAVVDRADADTTADPAVG